MVFTEKMASLGKLAAIVAHEINNPLAGVLVYTKLVRRRLPKLQGEDGGGKSIGELDETLATIEAETARCGDIVRNLLLFSRRGETAMAPVDVNTVLRRAVRLVQHQADLAVVAVETDLGELPPTICDASEIQQAVLAPLMNALEAMPDGGTLAVRTRHLPEAGEITVEIRDTGVGIPEDIRPKVFEPFFSTKSEGKGTGLGLAVMYGIIQHHGGRIDLESEVGRGTLFRIHLPVAGPGEMAAAAKTGPAREGEHS
jgi:two-component system NtrC family sensor kinase